MAFLGGPGGHRRGSRNNMIVVPGTPHPKRKANAKGGENYTHSYVGRKKHAKLEDILAEEEVNVPGGSGPGSGGPSGGK